jgi:hypothetical protein
MGVKVKASAGPSIACNQQRLATLRMGLPPASFPRSQTPHLPPAMMAKRLLPLLFLPLLLSCEDASDKLFPQPRPVQLPAETRVGANTFGCRVNGDVWEANNISTLAGKVLTPNVHYTNGELRIDAFRRLQVAGPVTNFYFTVGHVTGSGVYALAENGSSARLTTASGLVDYATDSPEAGTLTVTRLDTTGEHPGIAGRFSLRAVARPSTSRPADFPAELRITDGRFDIQLRH